jgi:hypothetical protein
MKKLIAFIVRSSADPRKTSLFVKSSLLGMVPLFMYATGIVCQLGYTCVDLTDNQLERLIDGIQELVFITLSIISFVGAAFGLIRKIVLTLAGENKALHDVN